MHEPCTATTTPETIEVRMPVACSFERILFVADCADRDQEKT
jgi:hypothetical protein